MIQVVDGIIPPAVDWRLSFDPKDVAATAPIVVEQDATSVDEKFELPEDVEDSQPYTIQIDTGIMEWTSTHEREFDHLVEDLALKRIDSKSEARLKYLKTARRRLLNPRTSAEVLLEFKQKEATKILIEALNKYVRFHKATDSPWKGSKTNVH